MNRTTKKILKTPFRWLHWKCSVVQQFCFRIMNYIESGPIKKGGKNEKD
jgi:hypothetical protein